MAKLNKSLIRKLVGSGVSPKVVANCFGVKLTEIMAIAKDVAIDLPVYQGIRKPTALDRKGFELFVQLYELRVLQGKSLEDIEKATGLLKSKVLELLKHYNIDNMGNRIPIWLKVDAYTWLKEQSDAIGVDFYKFINSLILFGWVAWNTQIEKRTEERIIKRLEYKIKELNVKNNALIFKLQKQVESIINFIAKVGFKFKE